MLDRYGPGKRELTVFVALVFLGFVVWFAGTPGSTSMVFGVDLPRWAQYDPPLSLLFVPVVCGALALVAGFAFDRGFYLWGIALDLHGPFVQGLTVHLMVQDGIELAGGRPGFVSYILISAVLLVFTIFCYTALSAMGPGHDTCWDGWPTGSDVGVDRFRTRIAPGYLPLRVPRAFM